MKCQQLIGDLKHVKNYISYVEIRFCFCSFFSFPVEITLKHSRFCHVIKCWKKKKEGKNTFVKGFLVCMLSLVPEDNGGIIISHIFSSFPKIALVAK